MEFVLLLLQGANRLGSGGDCVFDIGWRFGWFPGVRAGICVYRVAYSGSSLAMDFDAGARLPIGFAGSTNERKSSNRSFVQG